MSDTTIAILMLPLLIAVTVLLEYTRVGCTRAAQHLRSLAKPGGSNANRNLSPLQ